MSKDSALTPAMLPSIVVGILRERCRKQAATIATLKAKNQGQAVEIEDNLLRCGRIQPPDSS
jgi:hypothetical protein